MVSKWLEQPLTPWHAKNLVGTFLIFQFNTLQEDEFKMLGLQDSVVECFIMNLAKSSFSESNSKMKICNPDSMFEDL